MNFKFPSSLENPPPNPPFNSNPNPNSSYFTHQSIQAGYVANDVSRREIVGFPATGDVTRREYDGYTAAGDVGRRHYDGYAAAGDVPWREFDYSRNAASLRQREIEKDRIRAEIIAEEMMRRSLEEEVRREMIRDRELGFRYEKPEFGVGGSGSMGANFEYRGRGGASSYRDVEYGGGYHAMPVRRDRVVSGGGSGSGSGSGSGRRSGVMLREITEDKAVVLAKPRSNLSDLKRKTMMPSVGGAMDVYKKPKEGWSCALCQITTTSEQGLKDHYRGKKHQARESGTLPHMTGFGTVPLPKILSTNTVKPLTLLKRPSNPSLKNEGKSGVGSSLTNVGNSTTRKTNHIPLKVKRTSLIKKGNVKGKAPATVNRGNGNKKFPYFCEMCQIGSNSTIVFDAHMKGKKHLANLSVFNKTDETIEAEASLQKALTDEKKGEAKTPIIGGVGKPRKKYRYFCKMCQVGADSMIVFDTHKKGKRHAANLSLLNKTDEPAQVDALPDLARTEEYKELAAVETLMMGEPNKISGDQLASVETVMTGEPEETSGEQLAAVETLSEGEPDEPSEGEPEEPSEEEPEETSEGEPEEPSEAESEEPSEAEPEEFSEGEPEETSEEHKVADVSRPENGDKLLEIEGEGTLASKMTNQGSASSNIAS
ncbi:hypothetical protein vseg_016232 [Gypsophila vaccaria]